MRYPRDAGFPFSIFLRFIHAGWSHVNRRPVGRHSGETRHPGTPTLRCGVPGYLLIEGVAELSSKKYSKSLNFHKLRLFYIHKIE